jgi:hypothetical protein
MGPRARRSEPADSYAHHQDATSIATQHFGQLAFPRRPPGPSSRADDHQRIGWECAAEGFVSIAAKIDFDGGIVYREGFEQAFRELHRHLWSGEGQRIRHDLSNHQRDASAQASCHGPSECQRRGGLREIGKDDLKIELAIAAGKVGFGGRRATFEANEFVVHQFQARQPVLKAALRSGSTVSRKC